MAQVRLLPTHNHAERKSRSRETALSKTDVMILRLLLPHNAPSAPRSLRRRPYIGSISLALMGRMRRNKTKQTAWRTSQGCSPSRRRRL